MNTANLQLRCVLSILHALFEKVEQRGLLTRTELESVLSEAEDRAVQSAERADLTPSNVEAVRFPARFLRTALSADQSEFGFDDLAAEVGMQKSQ